VALATLWERCSRPTILHGAARQRRAADGLAIRFSAVVGRHDVVFRIAPTAALWCPVTRNDRQAMADCSHPATNPEPTCSPPSGQGHGLGVSGLNDRRLALHVPVSRLVRLIPTVDRWRPGLVRSGLRPHRLSPSQIRSGPGLLRRVPDQFRRVPGQFRRVPDLFRRATSRFRPGLTLVSGGPGLISGRAADYALDYGSLPIDSG
jgi:hypothetical protein